MAGPWEKYQTQPQAQAGPWQQYAPPQPVAAQQTPAAAAAPSFLDRLKGIGETALNAGTGGLAALGGGLNYLGTLAATQDPEAAQAVQQDTQQALTYAPRTPTGQKYAGNVGEALSYLGQKEGEYVGEKSAALASKLGASPQVAGVIGSALNTSIQAIPQVLGARGLKGGKVAAANPGSLLAQVDEARAAGYKLPPRMAGSKTGSVAEGMSNSAKLERGISVANQKVTQGLARKEIGLKGNGAISAGELDALRKKHNGAYEELGKSGRIVADEQFAREMFGVGERTSSMMKDFPEAASPAIEKLRNAYLSAEFDASAAIQATRKLRANANKYLKAFDDPEKQALGMASREIADALDAQLQRHADDIGNPKLAENFRAARQQLAKIHSVENALNESSGLVSARDLGKALERGAPLSGGLKTIAETARRFGKAVQDVEKLPARSVEFGDLIAGGGGMVAAKAAALNPLLGVVAVGARPAARSVLASELFQNQLGTRGKQSRNMLLRSGGIGAGVGAVAPKQDR